MMKHESENSVQPPSRKVRFLPEVLERRLTSYALAASAAGMALLATAQPAKANSIVYETLNQTLAAPGSLSFSLGDDTFTFVAGISSYVGFLQASATGGNFLGGIVDYSSRVQTNSVIGPSRHFTQFIGVMAFFIGSDLNEGGAFACGTGALPVSGCSGFLGLRLDLHGNTHYGWANATVRPVLETSPQTGTLVAFPELTLFSLGWNRQPNAPILAGQTSNHAAPEPSTLALLAAGAAGLAFWRSKKKK